MIISFYLICTASATTSAILKSIEGAVGKRSATFNLNSFSNNFCAKSKRRLRTFLSEQFVRSTAMNNKFKILKKLKKYI
jgi:hypothetical protein